jgi:hypothetical protein
MSHTREAVLPLAFFLPLQPRCYKTTRLRLIACHPETSMSYGQDKGDHSSLTTIFLMSQLLGGVARTSFRTSSVLGYRI